MLKTIHVMLEYGCYPVWLYDETGEIMDNLLPEELRYITQLDSMFDDLQARYEALFINNETEFSYVGFSSVEAKEDYLKAWQGAIDELTVAVNGKYSIIDALDRNSLCSVGDES